MSTKHKPSNLNLKTLKSASKKKFAIVYSEWNQEIINRLLEGAYRFFDSIGISKKEINELKVPGSYELIYGCSKVQSSDNYDAILAIGSIIRGETTHFKYISQSVFDGIKDLNMNGKCPIILCLLTDDNFQQSLDRSGGKYGNKGFDCAVATAQISLI